MGEYGSASALVAGVTSLLTLPEVYLKVKAVVDDPDSSLDQLVEAVSVDPAITARLLRMVNSAYFNLGVQVDSVRQAVNLMGMTAVHNLVLATSLSSNFSRAQSKVFDVRQFWESSVRSAVFARAVAMECDEDYDRLFVNGLLARVGQQAMFLLIPEQASKALLRSLSSDQSLPEIQQEMLGYDYAEVGAELLKAWGLPASITEVVRHQLDPDQSEQYRREASIIQIANALSDHFNQPLDEKSVIPLITPIAWQSTGMVPEILLELYAESEQELKETVDMMLGADRAA